MLIPGLTSLFLCRYFWQEDLVGTLALRPQLNRYILVAWLLPLILILSSILLSSLLPGVELLTNSMSIIDHMEDRLPKDSIEKLRTEAQSLPLHPILLGVLLGMLSGLTINCLAACGEEIGWRGFLHRELRPLGFWQCSFLTGSIWGLWHAPLILKGLNYPDHRYLGLLMMVVFCVLLAPLHHFLRERSRSVWAPSIFHGTINGLAGLTIVMVKGGSDLTVGFTGLAGFLSLLAANILLALHMSRQDYALSKEKGSI